MDFRDFSLTFDLEYYRTTYYFGTPRARLDYITPLNYRKTYRIPLYRPNGPELYPHIRSIFTRLKAYTPASTIYEDSSYELAESTTPPPR